MKIEDEITEENRDLVGFMGIDDEYLVLSPTFIQGGKVCRVDTIGFKAFADCKGLKHLVLLDGFLTIQDEAFSGCSSLASVDLPDSVRVIFNEVFLNCHTLTSITLPRKAEFIGAGAFSGCSAETPMGGGMCRGTIVPWLRKSRGCRYPGYRGERRHAGFHVLLRSSRHNASSQFEPDR